MEIMVMDSSTPSDKVMSKTVDPEGDIFLVCSSRDASLARWEILVSSRVLAEASSVFAEVFLPDAAGGIQLNATMAINQFGFKQGRITVDLLEDSVRAFWKLCMILHGKWEDAGNLSTVETFGAVLDVAFKYNCTMSLSSLAPTCLKEIVPRAGSEGYEKLLGIAYILENKPFFKEVTRHLVLNWEGNLDGETARKCQVCNIKLPYSMIELLRALRKDIRDTICHWFDYFHRLIFKTTYKEASDVNVACVLILLSIFRAFMEECDIEIGAKRDFESIRGLLDTISTAAVEKFAPIDERDNPFCEQSTTCICRGSPEGWFLFHMAHEEITFHGLCWDCWKLPKETPGECQACEAKQDTRGLNDEGLLRYHAEEAEAVKAQVGKCTSEKSKAAFLGLVDRFKPVEALNECQMS